MLAVLDKKIYVVTWLRYTLWMPLYPVGIFLEGKELPTSYVGQLCGPLPQVVHVDEILSMNTRIYTYKILVKELST